MEKSTHALEAFPLQTDHTVEGADEKFEISVVPVGFDFVLSFQTPEELGSEDITAQGQHKLVGPDYLFFRSLSKGNICS